MSTQQRLQLIQKAEAVLVKEPRNADALSNIGVLLIQEKRYPEAIPYLKRSLSARKKNLPVMLALADCYHKTKNYVECVKVRRKVSELQPRNLDYQAKYAESLQTAGKTKLATAVFEKLTNYSSERPDILNIIAAHHRSLGNYGLATEILNQIQAKWPGHPDSLYLYCNTKKFAQTDVEEYLPYINTALEVATDKVDICSMHYAAGKILEDVKRYKDAFRHYKQANDTRLADTNSNILPQFENAKNVYGRTFVKQRQFEQSHFNSNSRAIFVLGMPRSGTTLVESLCGAHSNISAGDELIFMSSMSLGLGSDSSAKAQFKTAMDSYSPLDFEKMRNDYRDKTKEIGTTAKYFTDKLPHNFLNIGLIKILFQNAKIIHCRRHPVDNCLSIFANSMRSFHIAYKSDLTTLGLYYRQYWQLMQHWRENISEPFHEVYYEDVVQNTELNARGLIEYLDLEWEDGVLDRKGSQKTIKTLSSWQARQPIYKTSAGKWRNYEKQLAPLIDALGPVVEEYESELEALQTR